MARKTVAELEAENKALKEKLESGVDTSALEAENKALQESVELNQKAKEAAEARLVAAIEDMEKPIVVNDAYKDPDFLDEIDKQTGYKTNNIITAPIFDSNRKIIGVLELLNKENGFDNDDRRFMIFFAHYISGFLELVNHLKESK